MRRGCSVFSGEPIENVCGCVFADDLPADTADSSACESNAAAALSEAAEAEAEAEAGFEKVENAFVFGEPTVSAPVNAFWPLGVETVADGGVANVESCASACGLGTREADKERAGGEEVTSGGTGRGAGLC